MFDYINSIFVKDSFTAYFITAVFGGIVGASFKIVFENILPHRLQRRRDIEMIMDKYNKPIVESTISLYKRIKNLLSLCDESYFKWSEYYTMSTLYVFCTFFGWLDILFGDLVLLKYKDTKRNILINQAINYVHKSFNNRSYFIDGNGKRIFDTSIHKYTCIALGECVVVSDGSQKRCMTFIEFCKAYQSKDKTDVQQWTKDLLEFLIKVKKDSYQWNRLNIISIALVNLLNVLDMKSEKNNEVSPEEVEDIYNRITIDSVKNELQKDLIDKEFELQIKLPVS